MLALDPLSGHVFAFINRRRNQIRLLMWTRGGFTIVHKRLEVGTFTMVERLRSDATHVELGAHELSACGKSSSKTPKTARYSSSPGKRGTSLKILWVR